MREINGLTFIYIYIYSLSIVNEPRSRLLNYVNWRGTTHSNGYSLLLTWSTFNLHYQCPPCNSRHLRDSDVSWSPANWQHPFWSHPDDVTPRWPIRAWFPSESGYPWGLWLAGRRGGLAIEPGIGWGTLDFPSSYISHSCIERPCLRAKRPREKIIQGCTLTFISPLATRFKYARKCLTLRGTGWNVIRWHTRRKQIEKVVAERRYFDTFDGSRSHFKVDAAVRLKVTFCGHLALTGSQVIVVSNMAICFCNMICLSGVNKGISNSHWPLYNSEHIASLQA